MKKLEKFYNIVNIGLIVFMLFLEGEIRHFVEKTKLEHEHLIFIIVIAILIAFFKFIEWLVELLVEKIASLRALILGDEYLEGVWCDRTTIDGKFYYAILSIMLKDGMYLINGSQYCSDGTEHHCWNTIASKFENPTIRFLYRSIYFNEQDKENEPMGYSSYSFEKLNLHHCPTSYKGKYKDFGKNSIERSFKGVKILKKDFLKNLRIPENQRSTVLEIIQFYFSEDGK